MLATYMATVAFSSFRFGPTDGVSVVARTWMDAFESFGFDVVTVAGDGDADRIVPGLAIGAAVAPRHDELGAALAGADLVVVENLCTIPLNVPAALVTAEVLAGRPAIMHHHDPPWHRARHAHVTELPIDDAAWRHVTINRITASEMAAHGFDTTVIHNAFEAPGHGDRGAQRRRLGVEEAELLVAHPVRAIERKNLPAAIRLAEQLDATYWLLGPPEEGYDDELAALLRGAQTRVIHEPCTDRDALYAAADVVAFPSTWEGFGNPPIEAALRRRPAAVGDYPFAGELRGMGFEFFEPADAAALRRFLDDPDIALLDHNERLAIDRFSIDRLRAALHDLLSEAGWLP